MWRDDGSGLAYVASPAASRRPDRNSSRCWGSRKYIMGGITEEVMASRDAPKRYEETKTLVRCVQDRGAGISEADRMGCVRYARGWLLNR